MEGVTLKSTVHCCSVLGGLASAFKRPGRVVAMEHEVWVLDRCQGTMTDTSPPLGMTWHLSASCSPGKPKWSDNYAGDLNRNGGTQTSVGLMMAGYTFKQMKPQTSVGLMMAEFSCTRLAAGLRYRSGREHQHKQCNRWARHGISVPPAHQENQNGQTITPATLIEMEGRRKRTFGFLVIHITHTRTQKRGF